MKMRIVFVTGLALMCAPVFAGGLTEIGLNDPEVVAPARVTGDWGGVYVGLSYGRNSTGEDTFACFKLGDPKDCDDPIFDQYPEYKVIERLSSKTSDDEVGAFAGYRHDFGRMVGGVELGVLGELESAEVQLGLDLGRLLVYGLAGGGQFDDASGTLYGAGADFKVGERVVIGAKYVTGDFDGNDLDSATVRVALTF